MITLIKTYETEGANAPDELKLSLLANGKKSIAFIQDFITANYKEVRAVDLIADTIFIDCPFTVDTDYGEMAVGVATVKVYRDDLYLVLQSKFDSANYVEYEFTLEDK